MAGVQAWQPGTSNPSWADLADPLACQRPASPNFAHSLWGLDPDERRGNGRGRDVSDLRHKRGPTSGPGDGAPPQKTRLCG